MQQPKIVPSSNSGFNFKSLFIKRGAAVSGLVIVLGLLGRGVLVVGNVSRPLRIDSMLMGSVVSYDATVRIPIDWYRDNDPYITALIRIGYDFGNTAPLVVDWYREDGSQQEKLFEHTMTVTCSDLAYSVGLNPGVFTPGTYKVVATLGAQKRELQWAIAPVDRPSLPKGAAGDVAITGVPQPGPSGRFPQNSIPEKPIDPRTAVPVTAVTNHCEKLF